MVTNEDLKTYCRGLYEAWNRGDMETFYAGMDAHITDHNAGEGETGVAGVRAALDTVRSAFPDHQYEVLDIVADAQTMSLVCRLACTGTQTGDLFGLPPHGKKARWIEARFVKLVEAEPGAPFRVRTKEHWAVTDSLSMMTQLGHVPAPGQRESW